MDFLYAKINQTIVKHEKLAGGFVKLLSDKTVFPDSLPLQSVIFSGSYHLEQQEWFKVGDMRSTPYLPGSLRESFLSIEVPSVDFSVNSDNIEYLMAIQDERYFCFQKVFKSRKLKDKRWLMLRTGDSQIQEISDGIVLQDTPDAIYDMQEDILYFQSLSRINSVFKGIISLYREATQEEVDLFIDNTPIQLLEGFTTHNIGTENRHRLAIVEDRIHAWPKRKREKLYSYVRRYIPDLISESGEFQAQNDEELKQILYGLDERYYQTEISGEKRLANSVLVMGSGKTS